ncbi:hypothetical protein [Niabella sp.]|uniref:hypothetical protein n=1 Tax=Niabella sp. TaxID=1962976 RepID=UPI002639A5BF|nr:hypothetical protein [Niabella sp.]
MKKKLIILSLFCSVISGMALGQEWVLNNADMNPAPATFPGGKETISFDFYLKNSPTPSSGYDFKQSGNKSGSITITFTKMNPTSILPQGTGADLFTWTMSTQGTNESKTYTWNGTTKNVNMTDIGSTPSKYKITFANVPVTYAATQAEKNISVFGEFTVPTGAPAGVDNDHKTGVATYSTTALPVAFQSYEAKIVGNKLVVNWTTATEKDNKYFDIEVMGTDSIFRSAGRVETKAENGTSDAAIAYSFEKDLATGSTSLMGIVVFAAGFILLLFNRKNKLLYALLVVCGVGMSTISCRKNEVEKMNREDSRKLVRIVQVDKEGAQAFSKVAVAVKQ